VIAFKIGATYPTASMNVTAGMNLAEALSIMCQRLNKGATTCTARWEYNDNGEAKIIFDGPAGTDIVISTVYSKKLDQFFDLLNVPEADRADYTDASKPRTTWIFPKAWNRLPSSLYFHASFVNHTQFNYLGRHGDFYPKPSKIYLADNLPMECYFWLTEDGMTPIELPFENFIIELAFIVDSKDYQSP
jgi:hypothetical protein